MKASPAGRERANLILLIFALFLSFILLTPTKLKAAEDDLYDFLWLDPDKEVYVLQNKVFSKKGSLYANVNLLKGISTDFQNTWGYMLRTGYYFTEEWGFEVLYSDLNNRPDDTFKAVTAVNGTVPFVRRITSYYGAMAVWSPFYGKINTFNKIYYFDVNFGLGAARINAETNREDFNSLSPVSHYQKESYNGPVWKAEMRFHVTERWHVNTGVMNLHYKAQGARTDSRKQWKMNTDAFIGVGFSF